MLGKVFNATTITFVAIVALVVAWIGSGMVGREPAAPQERAEQARPVVAASASQAREVTNELLLYGDVEPVQIAVVRARVEGVVEEVLHQGRGVSAGETIARLSDDDRVARRARAEAQLAEAQRANNSARELFDRRVGPEANIQSSFAQLEAARAELGAIELEIANTRVPAPIAGTINRVIADNGAYVSAGGEVLEIVDNDPLLAVVNVQQQDVSRVRPGMPARVNFIGGDRREGSVTFVSPIADAATRTFRVEVQVANPEGSLPSGISAEVVIPVETVEAHYITPAFARLDSTGRMGVYVVDAEDRIQFAPMEIVKADAGGIMVRGLPDKARIVTISRGALNPGQTVNVEETPAGYLTEQIGPDRVQTPSTAVDSNDASEGIR